jgi:hypothetical protein
VSSFTINMRIVIDENEVDRTKSGLVFNMVNSMGTYAQAARAEYVSKHLKGLPEGHHKNTLEAIKVHRVLCGT